MIRNGYFGGQFDEKQRDVNQEPNSQITRALSISSLAFQKFVLKFLAYVCPFFYVRNFMAYSSLNFNSIVMYTVYGITFDVSFVLTMYEYGCLASESIFRICLLEEGCTKSNLEHF